ncbi:MAG: AAA family ATPase, partial [Alphaproteobacteria bacterium]|nr:AAA family ATPase [Alphaproteobacteria bacterium]
MSKPGHVIVLGNEKGGTGKSTVAMHVIVGLMDRGAKVGSIDLDARQATLSRYVDNRRLHAGKHGLALELPVHEAVLPTGQDQGEDARQKDVTRLETLIA